MFNHHQSRQQMVDGQLIERGIADERVLEAMRKVPRHEFVPMKDVINAYRDGPLPIGDGQTISQPYIVALMSEALAIDKSSRVLEIGTGSGYQTAVLAEIAHRVTTVERIGSLSKSAQLRLSGLHYNNIDFYTGDGFEMFKTFNQKFQGIMVTAALKSIPDNLSQLLTEDGCMVAPIGQRDQQQLLLYKKEGRKLNSQVLCGCVFVPLIGKYGWV